MLQYFKKKFIPFYQIKSFRIHPLILEPKILQLILINNGSLTQNLNSALGTKIKVDIIQQSVKKNNEIIRVIILKDKSSNLVFAVSDWQENQVHFLLRTVNYQPIGQFIINNELDIRKHILCLKYGYCYYIEKKLRINQSICYRLSKVYYKNKILNTIQEFIAFQYLGEIPII
uniref:Uncharacterized protein n=1 Tax=Neogoniolithon spectabile TaxID=231755 RepID=A0A3G3MH25_9FLOR|nr:hypothetical protein [Neogoniolithon spectabile]AYR06123.1 hypothetical protein [Neogoniolithon spectabile]